MLQSVSGVHLDGISWLYISIITSRKRLIFYLMEEEGLPFASIDFTITFGFVFNLN